MFKLEKLFQNDESGYLIFINFIKSIILFISIYIFSILKENSIFELFEYKIFKNSDFFYFSIIFCIIFYLSTLFFYEKRKYNQNFLTFLREDISNFIISNITTFFLIFLIKLDLIF